MYSVDPRYLNQGPFVNWNIIQGERLDSQQVELQHLACFLLTINHPFCSAI